MIHAGYSAFCALMKTKIAEHTATVQRLTAARAENERLLVQARERLTTARAAHADGPTCSALDLVVRRYEQARGAQSAALGETIGKLRGCEKQLTRAMRRATHAI